MPSENIVLQIEEALAPNEQREDFAFMIDTLTWLRSPYHDDDERSERVTAILLCVFFPDKPAQYIDRVREFRLSFKGVFASPELQAHYANSVRPAALLVPTPDAIVWNPSLYFNYERFAEV